MVNILTATLICAGTAPSTPATNIEVEIRPGKYSTIRYEIAEGSLIGTAYVQSIGHMIPERRGPQVKFQSGDGPTATILTLEAHGTQITNAKFSHFISDMKESDVDCEMDTNP